MKWLIVTAVIVVVVLIAVPLVIRKLQDRDYQRQINGEIPMREAEETTARSENASVSPEMQAEAARMRGTITGNSIGPK